MKAELKVQQSKAGAERKIHNTSIEQLDEFNRTIRDLRLQLQQSQRLLRAYGALSRDTFVTLDASRLTSDDGAAGAIRAAEAICGGGE